MSIKKFLLSVYTHVYENYVVSSEDIRKEYYTFRRSIQTNDIADVARILKKSSLGARQVLFKNGYEDFVNFLGNIQSKEMLSLLIQYGLDINRRIPSKLSERSNLDNLPFKAPALFYVAAMNKTIHRWDLFNWIIESGGANFFNKERISQLLLKEYDATLSNLSEKDTTEIEKENQKYKLVFQTLKNHGYAFNIEDLFNSMIKNDLINMNGNILFEYLLDNTQVLNQNYDQYPEKYNITIFIKACHLADTMPYMNILLEKYKNDEAQLNKFQNQLNKDLMLYLPSKKAQIALTSYLEKATFKNNIELNNNNVNNKTTTNKKVFKM